MVSDIKFFMMDHDSIVKTEDGWIIPGRCGDLPIRVGDEIGHCIVTKIEIYGKEVDQIDPIVTGAITVKGKHLGTMIVESRPLCYNLDDLRKERAFLDELIAKLEKKANDANKPE